jgi:hypothetical protein
LSYVYSDPEDDDEGGTEIRWYRNGILQGNYNDSKLIPALALFKGDQWNATVRPKDSRDFGPLASSPTILVQNTPLTMTSCSINNNANQTFADTILEVTWSYYDLDGDSQAGYIIVWYKDDEYQTTYENQTEILPSALAKGQRWHCVVQLFDGEDWSQNRTSQAINIVNKPPEIETHSYKFSDVDNDTDSSIIHWYKNGVYNATYDNVTFVSAIQTSPGDVWSFEITPFDGTAYGLTVASQNMTIESRPTIHECSFLGLPEKEGLYTLWFNVSDLRNPIVRVQFDTPSNSYLAKYNGTYWIVEVVEFNISLLDSLVQVTATAISIVEATDDLIPQSIVFQILIEDKAPPRVLDATYFWNDDENPTNITFLAIIEDASSDNIAQVLISYYFLSSAEVPTNTTTTEGGIHLYSLVQNEIDWSSAPSAAMTFNGTHWVVTVPFEPKTSVKIYYKMYVMDNDGNVNDDAWPAGKLGEGIPFTLKEAGGVDPEFFQQILLIVAVAFLAVIAFSAVAIRKWRTTELVGLDRERVLGTMGVIEEDQVKGILASHTLGVVVSFFDQRHGPIPIIIVPEILRDNYDKLVDLSDQSFSVCQFMDNFKREKFAIFDFTLEPTLSINSISFAFALERPNARGGSENITLNILVQPNVFPLVSQFVDHFSQKVHEIHVLMDKSPPRRDKILEMIVNLRMQISYIILSYERLYGTTELLLEEDGM